GARGRRPNDLRLRRRGRAVPAQARHGPSIVGRVAPLRDLGEARRAHGHRDRRVQRGDVPLRGRVRRGRAAAPHRREPRARGAGDRRVQHDEGVRRHLGRPGARGVRGLDARRRGDAREDGLRLAAPAHGERSRAARARARVPAHGRQALQPGRVPGRDGREPDPAGAQVPADGRLQHRRDRRALRGHGRGAGRGRSHGLCGAASLLAVARVEVTPEQFTLVEYDAGVIAGIAEELASRVALPDEVPVRIEIDEELPLPLTGSTADVVDGGAVLWFSGANFEDGRHRAAFNDELARTELALALFRAGDRLQGFADAPVDEDLSDAQRAAWEASAEGRAARLGEFTRKVRRQYVFRLYNGFTDVADDAFERLWTADQFTWGELDALCAECKAADPRPEPKQKS